MQQWNEDGCQMGKERKFWDLEEDEISLVTEVVINRYVSHKHVN